MTSTNFIKEVAEKVDMSQKAVREVVQACEDVLYETLGRGESVKFADVNYDIKDVDARVGRNPRTGESVEIPATKKVVVKPSSTLKKFFK